MFKKLFGKVLCYPLIPLLVLASISAGSSVIPGADSGTRERLLVGNGTVEMSLNSDLRATNCQTELKRNNIHFEISPNSFFTIVVFNNVLRGPEPGSIGLIGGGAQIPELNSSQLVIEKIRASESYDLVVRDGKTGFLFFNVEGNLYDYDPATRSLSINGGRLLISEDFANKLGHPEATGEMVGEISITASTYPIEVTTFVNGAIEGSILPARKGSNSPTGGGVPGPDIIVGDMNGLAQFGSASGQVGLGIGTTSCNNGDQSFHFYQLPNADHSVVTQNLYRMSGGANNDERFEQIGGAWVKHTFGANQDDACSFGCTPFPNATELGVGCSDPYLASQNASQGDHVGALGSRAWVNPFTGFFPTDPRPESHAGHVHTGTSHRVLVNASDLNTTMNTGATYYAEVQYDSPQEYAWCQTHPSQCNMYNNASYRRYNVSGTTSFTFAAVGSTVRMRPATGAWTGATSSKVEPEPGIDGRAFVVYKVSGPVAGVWHYEYGIHNQNLDRSVQSFSVPLACGVNVSNIGFHAPPNHPGFANDGTVGNTGFSNTAWTATQTATDLTWNTETFAQNQNANAIRFGTMYNFRFDSDRPPTSANATVGFFKTGSPITVAIQVPSDACTATPTPAPSASPTPPTNINISGNVANCSNPSLNPVVGVAIDYVGTTSGSTLTDASGNYLLSSIVSGGSYTVTPFRASLLSGSDGINTIDVVATQRHFLNIASLTGCRLTAGDVNGDAAINTVDVIAIQRFFLALSTGIADVGEFRFSPVSRSYSNVTGDQTGQNYNALVLGDVATPFVQ